MDISIAANVLGTLGAVCWSIQLIPQIIINYRRHNTTGLQRSMMLLWACAGVPLGAYNVTWNFNIALQIQPQILSLLSLITWIQCFHYDNKWPVRQCCLVVGGIGLLFGGVEAAIILGLKAGVEAGRYWPVTMMGIVSTILLSAGVLRHYYDIYIHRTVRGISFIFVGIDAAGDLFSLISIFFQPSLNILGMVIYATEFTLWLGVFSCGGYFNFAPWLRQKVSRRSAIRANAPDAVAAAIMLEQRLGESTGVSIDVDLQRVSSTSVFRTSSSVLAEERGGAS